MQSADPPPSSAPLAKRPRLTTQTLQGLQVSLETGADGKQSVRQVFSDGSYMPAPDTHFERTSAAATAFVARALAVPTASASIQANTPEPRHPNTQWAAKAVTSIEGALYELGRAVAVIEGLRSATPVLELTRSVTRTGKPEGEAAEKEIEGNFAMKKRLVLRSAEFLEERVKAMHIWMKGDNAFCDAFLALKTRCLGVRRTTRGEPIIDVGDRQFVVVGRGDNPVDDNPQDLPSDDPAVKGAISIQLPAQTVFKFGLDLASSPITCCPAPVVVETDRHIDEKSLTAYIRRIRMSRISSFRNKAFDQITKEASEMASMIELTTNTVAFESGPSDILRIEKTQAPSALRSLDVVLDSDLQLPADFVELQNASLLQMICMHSCLLPNISGPTGSPNSKILDRLLAITTSKSVLSATERVLDRAVNMMRVCVEWTRGAARLEEARAYVFSTAADGDGPRRALATIEPISKVNNAGNESHNGHVRITPAFGVIIPIPDDPSARGRAVAPHSSSSGGTSSALGLDDVPRSYICPVGGEMLSVLTLLLCIRLLDALETAARAREEEMLDVDRQCFMVIVCAPKTGRTLRAKVWPKGGEVGSELPGSLAWLNGQKVQDFPNEGPGRVAAWKKLLRKLVSEEEDVKEKGNGTGKNDGQMGGTGNSGGGGGGSGFAFAPSIGHDATQLASTLKTIEATASPNHLRRPMDLSCDPFPAFISSLPLSLSTFRTIRPKDHARPTTRESSFKPTHLSLSPDPVILSVDIGTSATKAALCKPGPSNQLGPVFRVSHPTLSTSPSHVTQSPNDWFNGAIDAARLALEQASDSVIPVAIAVTGQMQDLIAVGSSPPSILASDAILYSDSRAFQAASDLTSRCSIPISATSLLAKLTLLPRPASSYSLLFGAADYILHEFSSPPKPLFVDATTASTTGLTFPPHRAYDTNLFELAGLTEFLPLHPTILPGPRIVGHLSVAVANKLNRPDLTGIPLVHAGGDAFSATVGAERESPGDWYLYCGSSGWIGGTQEYNKEPNEGVLTLGHASNASWQIALGSMASAGANLEFCGQTLFGGLDISTVSKMAGEAPIGSNGVCFLPYLRGKRGVRNGDAMTGLLGGMTGGTSQKDIARAVVEGTVFGFVEMSQMLSEEFGGKVRMVGGGVQCETFVKGVAALIGNVEVGEGGGVGVKGAGRVAGKIMGLGELDEDWTGKEMMVDGNEKAEWKKAMKQWERTRGRMEGF